MIIFYSLLIALCFYMELSKKINTENILNKIGICIIMVGALLKIYFLEHPMTHPNNLIAIGVFLHLLADIHKVRKYKIRREADRRGL